MENYVDPPSRVKEIKVQQTNRNNKMNSLFSNQSTLGLRSDDNKPYGDIKVGYKKFIRDKNHRQYGSNDSTDHGGMITSLQKTLNGSKSLNQTFESAQPSYSRKNMMRQDLTNLR